MKGGLFGALKRAAGGNQPSSQPSPPAAVPVKLPWLGAPGDIAAIEMHNQTFFVQSSSYLAGDASLVVDTKRGGASPSSAAKACSS
jgi:uncharacterized protein (AIM24 family)